MPYDEHLAQRIRALLADADGLTEKRMFGGLAFLIGGHMAVAAGSDGGLMVRVPPAETDALLEEPGAEPMVMRGRAMEGWLRVRIESVADDGSLERWVSRGVGYARTLPPKT
jgi:TfoX/Sxy family transcriptional regulator of competence genes